MSEPTNLPGNSHKDKRAEAEHERKIEKVVTGEVAKREKSVGRKFRESFAGDDAQTVGQYLLFDVVVPAVKNLIVDMVGDGIQRLLFGEGGGSRRSSFRGSGASSSYTPYGKMFNGRDGRPERVAPRERRDAELADFVFDSRAEAQDVLLSLEEAIKAYGSVSVMDFYDAIGKTAPYTDQRWGWTDLKAASVRAVAGGGHVLELPRAEQIR
jgi:hypothetical protein